MPGSSLLIESLFASLACLSISNRYAVHII
jgi:hypothetical protein